MKTYQEPATEIVEIEAADVITTSGVATDNTPGYNDTSVFHNAAQ